MKKDEAEATGEHPTPAETPAETKASVKTFAAHVKELEAAGYPHDVASHVVLTASERAKVHGAGLDEAIAVVLRDVHERAGRDPFTPEQ